MESAIGPWNLSWEGGLSHFHSWGMPGSSHCWPSCQIGNNPPQFCSFWDSSSPAPLYLSQVPLSVSLARTVFDSKRQCRWLIDLAVWNSGDLGSKWQLSLNPSISSACALLLQRPFYVIQVKEFSSTFLKSWLGCPSMQLGLCTFWEVWWWFMTQVTAGHYHWRLNHFLQQVKTYHCGSSKFFTWYLGKKQSLGAFQIMKEAGFWNAKV